MRKFEFVKDVSERFSGKAYLYRVDPPVEYFVDGETIKLTPYVCASATSVPLLGPQVFIFPANENGELLDWGEIGGRKGTLDIDKVMREWAGR
ncbi:MAG: hypothetical protein N2511_07725 [Thermodesulfovibrionales bacterium]|nr:hypothetical protein [Thermodesulfovibrionales bacterium]